MNGAFLFPAPSRNTHVGQKELMRGGVGGWGVQVCLRMYRTYVCLRTCRSANSFIYTSCVGCGAPCMVQRKPLHPAAKRCVPCVIA